MSLAPGTQLGPYQVIAPLGSGGMGDVYRCKDVRLDRTVAVKTLPTQLMADPEFRDRFAREANVLSRLDHPNICAVHDVGESGGVAYVVMPVLEGQTLADWIAASRIQGDELVAQALDIAKQVADALDHAHGRGVVHRDLKPANVMLTPQGVKLLDFGIARLVGGAETAQNETRVGLTRAGQVLGTPAYMAPEQLQGMGGDARSDVWAFGAVLFEMLTGRPFAATSPSRTPDGELEALVKGGTPMPAALRHFLARCLAAEPADRWSSGRDLALELRWLSVPREQASAPRPSRSRTWAAVAGAAAFGAIAAFAVAASRAPVAKLPAPQRLSLIVANTAPFTVGGLPNGMAISPDGSGIAHMVWNEGRAGLLHYRNLSEAASRPLTGTQGAIAPFFSPDGRWIGFLAGRRLRKVPIDGGGVVDVGAVGDRPGQPTWLSDDRIVFPDATGLAEISAGGGAPRVLIAFDPGQGETEFNSPTYLRVSNSLVFAIRHKDAGWNAATIVAQRLDTNARSVLVEGGFAPRVIGERYLVFSRGTNLLAASIDESAARVVSAPVSVVEGVSSPTTFGWSQSAISTAGTLVYAATAPRVPGRLVWVDRRGVTVPAHSASRVFEHPRLSPDGRQFVVGVRGDGIDVFVGNVGGDQLERLSFNSGEDESPVWHPDGRQVAYATSRNGRRFTVAKTVGSKGEEQELADHGTWHHHLGAWSPDGKMLTLAAAETSGLPWSPFALTPSSPTALTRKSEAPFSVVATTFSPDGRWLAYASDESGRSEIYVSPVDDLGTKRQVTSEGGAAPLWSRSGNEIYYQRGDRMFVVAVSTSPQFTLHGTEPLFDGVFEEIYWGERNYDATVDGKRFLMIRPEAGRPIAELRVVLNWLTELGSKLGH
jgi:eukaryotic-like serine/threonine-protein kinase